MLIRSPPVIDAIRAAVLSWLASRTITRLWSQQIWTAPVDHAEIPEAKIRKKGYAVRIGVFDKTTKLHGIKFSVSDSSKADKESCRIELELSAFASLERNELNAHLPSRLRTPYAAVTAAVSV